MKILAIETSGKICAVALQENNDLLDEIIINDANTHSVKLLPIIDEILKKNNIDISDIDLFACSLGPGSFTGIRIGIATIKGFADALDKKVIGISSLTNLAYNTDQDGYICPIIDAKNENIYTTLLDKNKENVSTIIEEKFSNINDYLIELKKFKEDSKKIIFIGDGALIYKDKIKEIYKDVATFINDENTNNLNAKNIAKLAYVNRENAINSNMLKPIYLRKSNAERQLENKDESNN